MINVVRVGGGVDSTAPDIVRARGDSVAVL